MKTGRLLKFRRGPTEIQAYLYADGQVVRAALYVMRPGARPSPQPDHELSGTSQGEVEAAVRAWVDARRLDAP